MKTPSRDMIEILESRIAPAGVVTVTTTPAGELTIDGDGANNFFDLFQTAPNSYRIEATGGTTLTVDGTAGLKFFDFAKLTRIAASGNGGGDQFTFTNLSNLKSFTVDGGAGDDLFTLTNVSVKGDMNLLGGDGSDAFNFEGLTLKVAGDLKLTDTNDGISMSCISENAVIGGSLIVVGGTGQESISNDATGTLKIGQGVELDAGVSGNFHLNFNQNGLATIGKLPTGESFLASGEGGFDISLTGGDFMLLGGIQMTGGSATPDSVRVDSRDRVVTIGKLATGESILLNGGGGGGGVTIGAMNVTLKGGIEFSNTSLQGALVLTSPDGKITVGKLATGQSIKYTGSADQDALTTDVAKLVLKGGIEMAGGNGANTLGLGGDNGTTKVGKLSTGASIVFTGGSGADSVSLNAANVTLAGGIDFTGGDGTNGLGVIKPGSLAKIGKLKAGGASIKYAGGSNSDEFVTVGGLLNLAGGIDFNGGAGGNSFSLANTAGKVIVGELSTGQSIKYLGGASDDLFNTDAASVVFAGGLEIAAGDGDNSFVFSGDAGLVSIGKLATGESIVYTGGAGKDTLSSTQGVTNLAGGIDFTPGNGINLLDFDDNGKVTIGKVATGQSVKYTGGTGDDSASLGGNLRIKGSIEMNDDHGGENAIDVDGNSIMIGKDAAGDSIRLNGSAGTNTIDLRDSPNLAGSIRFEGDEERTLSNFSESTSCM